MSEQDHTFFQVVSPRACLLGLQMSIFSLSSYMVSLYVHFCPDHLSSEGHIWIEAHECELILHQLPLQKNLVSSN